VISGCHAERSRSIFFVSLTIKKTGMKKVFLFSFFLFTFSFLTVSCHCKKKACFWTNRTVEVKKDFEKEGYVKATVINYTVDGCTFLLQLTDEKKLEPTNLSEEFKKDNLPVWIKYSPKKGAVSVCMAGQIVELSDIQLRK
jgi:hypothetical protein